VAGGIYIKNGPITLEQKYEEFKKEINVFLEANLPAFSAEGQRLLGEAMSYGVTSGGKRIRGVLALAVCELLGGDMDAVLPIAGSIEYIHAYSLIHDDLPCMDDDDFRRGKPSCHKVYGEGIAVLAGDALLNHAFEMLLNSAVRLSRGYRFVEAAAYVAGAAGAGGMAGGQAVDLCADIRDETRLAYLHRLKTGKLFNAAILAPAICLGANGEDYEALLEYSNRIGLAFQIKDDIQDTAGEGKIDGERNYVSLIGARRASQRLYENCRKAVGSLSKFTWKADFLRDITGFISES